MKLVNNSFVCLFGLCCVTSFAGEQLIAISPNGRDNTGGRVFRITLDPFDSSVVGLTEFNYLSGLSTQPGTGTLFASSGIQDGGRLFNLNPATGEATLVADILGDIPDGHGVSGLAFAPDGTLFGTTPYRSQEMLNSDLYKIDPQTGAATLIGSTGQPGIDSIAFNSSGTLYGMTTFNTGRLVMIDANTGMATSLGLLREQETRKPIINVFEIQGLAFDSSNNLYGSAGSRDGRIVQIDPDTVTYRFIGDAADTSVSDLSFVFTADPPPIPYDFDGNGSLGVADLDLLSSAVRAKENDLRFDVTGDNVIDEADLRAFVTSPDKLNTYFGDSNLDGEFNSRDFVAVFTAGQYEDGVPLNSNWSQGDWNGDAEFDSSDFVMAFQGDGFERGPRAANAVPEPTSMLLACLALGSVCLSRQSVQGKKSLLGHGL